MASCDDAEWYFEGSGVPAGWNARAVGFSVVPLPLPLAAGAALVSTAPGAIVRCYALLCYVCYAMLLLLLLLVDANVG
jgi:hypothetical protein